MALPKKSQDDLVNSVNRRDQASKLEVSFSFYLFIAD